MGEVDKKTQSSYEHKLSDWMSIEAIVRQRDKETTAANIAKLSGGKIMSYYDILNCHFCYINIEYYSEHEHGHLQLFQQHQHE